MGFLDRFKKQKELEVEKKGVTTPAVEAVQTKESKTEAAPAKAEKGEKPKKSAAAKAPKTAEKKEKTGARVVSEALSHVLVRPLVTEKAAGLTSFGQYAFVVADDANRVQIRQAVKAVYGVTPVSVRVQNVRAQSVRFGRFRGSRKAWKKAIVTLPKGKTIDVHEGV